MKQRPIVTAKKIGGRLALDFLNTMGGRSTPYTIRDERLNSYEDLLAFAIELGIVTKRPSPGGPELAARARALREAIYRMTIARIENRRPNQNDLALFNGELARVQRVVNENFEYTYKKTDAPEQILWPIVIDVAEMFTSADFSRIRACPGDNCGWLFEDHSRPGRRQWCTMSDCGNLAKVHRFRTKR